jgi:branched-chain amino acid transport system ATP-binding protein
MAALAVKDLSKSYGGVRALSGVSFSIAPGEIVAMIGPNGAGKTTCFNMLSGQLAPDSGEVLLGDASLAGLAPHDIARLGVGRTFQRSPMETSNESSSPSSSRSVRGCC